MSPSSPGRDAGGRPGALERARLAARIVSRFALVVVLTRRYPLPEAVTRLGRVSRRSTDAVAPRRLGWLVHRTLRVGGHRPRCLLQALVLHRLLREQGDEPVVVIGLPGEAHDHRAHAWVEVDGTDVGPPPGSRGHEAIARYA